MTDTTKAFLSFIFCIVLLWGVAIFLVTQEAWIAATLSFLASFLIRTGAVEDGPGGDGSRSKFSLTEIYVKRKGFKGFDWEEK